jgi:hypothetical protein
LQFSGFFQDKFCLSLQGSPVALGAQFLVVFSSLFPQSQVIRFRWAQNRRLGYNSARNMVSPEGRMSGKVRDNSGRGELSDDEYNDNGDDI